MGTIHRRALMVLLGSLVAAACGGYGSPNGPSSYATLRGTVHVIPTGPPISGATVTVQGKSAVTDANGGFTVNTLSIGETTVTLARDGFTRNELRLTLNAGDNFFSLGMSPVQ